jgi:hypothetical protein
VRRDPNQILSTTAPVQDGNQFSQFKEQPSDTYSSEGEGDDEDYEDEYTEDDGDLSDYSPGEEVKGFY